MKLNEFAQAVHENAVAHGWYESEVEFPAVAALIHSEISEALAEYRAGNPVVYGCCGLQGAACEYAAICAETCDRPEAERSCKPEGLAVELCDAVLRCFDYLAFLGVDIEALLEAKHAYNTGRPYRHGGKRA